MAESGEAERPEEGEGGLDTGAAAIAAGLDEARADPALRGPVSAFFQAQTELIAAQKHHLRIQLRQLHFKTWGEGFKLGLQAVSLVAVLAVVVMVGLTVRDAMNDYGLVVESFSAPPDLAEKGMTGQSLAEQMRGRIAAIRQEANANSVTVSDDIQSGERETLKVEVPETGLSLDEVDRFLHRRLGHARRLGGEVTETEAGQITIEVHLSGSDPISVTGDRKDLDGLMQKAAEQAFARFDPVNWVIYLRAQNRPDEALAAADHDVTLAQDPVNLAEALSLSANSDLDRRRALMKATEAFTLDPKMWAGWEEAGVASEQMGHDALAVAFCRRAAAAKTDDQLRYHRLSMPYIRRLARMRIDRLTGDYPALAREVVLQVPNSSDSYSDNRLRMAAALAGQHDCAGLDHQVDLAQIGGGLAPDDAAEAARLSAVCREDGAASAVAAQRARIEVERLIPAHGRGPNSVIELALATKARPNEALALARAGNLAGAETLAAQTPPDCYLCVRTRGEIASLRHDWPGAEHWFAEAVRQAPDLAFAYEGWGRMLLARGDPAGAATKFAAAARRGPDWADPLKDWGDALARQGQPRQALAKYDLALKLAPNWSALRAARDAAAKAA